MAYVNAVSAVTAAAFACVATLCNQASAGENRAQPSAPAALHSTVAALIFKQAKEPADGFLHVSSKHEMDAAMAAADRHFEVYLTLSSWHSGLQRTAQSTSATVAAEPAQSCH